LAFPRLLRENAYLCTLKFFGMMTPMRRFRERVTRARVLAGLRRRLLAVLDAGQRRHVADLRFYQLLSDGDSGGAASVQVQRRAPLDR
jgi:hypothetical protein